MLGYSKISILQLLIYHIIHERTILIIFRAKFVHFSERQGQFWVFNEPTVHAFGNIKGNFDYLLVVILRLLLYFITFSGFLHENEFFLSVHSRR